MFLNSIGSCFRIYDDRDAEEHISILEDNYEPEADGEERAGLPDRNKILPPCMKRKPMGGKGLKAMLSRMAPKSRAARLLRSTLELKRVSDRVKLPELMEFPQSLNSSRLEQPLPKCWPVHERRLAYNWL